MVGNTSHESLSPGNREACPLERNASVAKRTRWEHSNSAGKKKGQMNPYKLLWPGCPKLGPVPAYVSCVFVVLISIVLISIILCRFTN